MFGIWRHKQAAEITYYGLHAMQHRGQDGAGIVVSDKKELKQHKDVGLVNDEFTSLDSQNMVGREAVGHVRYATQDDGLLYNQQPLVFHSLAGSIATDHNRKIMNANNIRRDLE